MLGSFAAHTAWLLGISLGTYILEFCLEPCSSQGACSHATPSGCCWRFFFLGRGRALKFSFQSKKQIFLVACGHINQHTAACTGCFTGHPLLMSLEDLEFAPASHLPASLVEHREKSPPCNIKPRVVLLQTQKRGRAS